MNNEEHIVETTKNWIENVVIGLNFCPFAAKPFQLQQVDYQVVKLNTDSDFSATFLAHCQRLSDTPKMETSLLIIPDGLDDFYTYLEVLDQCQALIETQGYEGVFQLASFHPQYQFAGTEPDDVTNYTNRSPYPIIQLLREESLEKVLENYEHPEEIPERNMRRAKEMGVAWFQQILNH